MNESRNASQAGYRERALAFVAEQSVRMQIGDQRMVAYAIADLLADVRRETANRIKEGLIREAGTRGDVLDFSAIDILKEAGATFCDAHRTSHTGVKP